MTFTLWIAALFCAGTALAAVWAFARLVWAQVHPDPLMRHRVLVNLDTGRTFAGVLWCKTGDWLVLRNAELIERGERPVPVDGEVIVERGTVEFVQVL